MIATRLHPDKQTAAQAIAREIADLIEIRSKSGKSTVLGLATGSTPSRSMLNSSVFIVKRA